MNSYLLLFLIAVTGGVSLRCFHEISSFDQGGENRYDRPSVVIRYPWLATAGGVMILPTIILLAISGYKLSGWLAAFLTPVLTLSFVVPLAYQVFRVRSSFVSMLLGIPFFLVIPFFPTFLVLFALAQSH